MRSEVGIGSLLERRRDWGLGTRDYIDFHIAVARRLQPSDRRSPKGFALHECASALADFNLDSRVPKSPVPKSPVRYLEPQPPKILTVPNGAGRWCPQAWQHVLFDDDPPGVAGGAERVDHSGERHHAAAQLAENPAADSGVVVPALGAGCARKIGVAV